MNLSTGMQTNLMKFSVQLFSPAVLMVYYKQNQKEARRRKVEAS